MSSQVISIYFDLSLRFFEHKSTAMLAASLRRPDFKAVVASLGTQVSYMDQCGIALADGRECGLWYAQRDADLFSSSSAAG